MNELDRS